MQQKQQSPTAIFSACAPTDIQGLERWEAHLRPLEQAGTVSIWSVRHLQPGTDRLKHLSHHLDQADLIVLLLSADFFTDGECEALMEHALERHQQGTARVIPLLLSPFAFRETRLATFTPLPSDGRPVTMWENTEAAFEDCVRGLRRILGRLVTEPLAPPKKRASIEEQNRERMLLRLRRTYEELFTQSLQGVTRMELGLADRPDAVQNAVTLLFQTPTRETRLLPPDTSILDVYDEATHELLILGAPGSGKSTLLVELARLLVVRAEIDDTHPLPVILPLSSWAVKHPPLQIWLTEQVARIYTIPKTMARQWIKKDRFLLLLDGLDEMDEAARPDCIAAINAYHRDHLGPLVICSRTNEYDRAAKRERLALHTAVIIQPLSYAQVDAYLTMFGKSLSGLRTALMMHRLLQTMATTPLMLQVLMLAYHGIPIRDLPQKEAQLREQIWTDYIQNMIKRKGDAICYPLGIVITRLRWLASEMRSRNQTIFFLEQLQPGWLPKKQRSLYQLSIMLFVGLPCGLLGLHYGAIGLFAGLSFLLLTGLHSDLKETELAETLIRFRPALLIALLVGLLFGVITSGLILGLLFGLLFGLVMGLLIPLLDRLLITLLDGLWRRESSGKQLTEHFIHSPNEGIRRSGKNGLFVGLLAGLLVGLLGGLLGGLVTGLLAGLLTGLLAGLLTGLLFGLFEGLGAVVRHYTLRVFLARSGVLPWKAIPFLEDATARILLRRVGGGYSFVHRLLMDHLADLPTGPTPTSATHLSTSRNFLSANNSST